MKIKEFSVTRYGPLPEKRKISLSDFNLFWGKNEEGKTLLIEAIIKLMLWKDKDIKNFENIDRVEEKPEGYVVIEHGGKEIKLPQKGDKSKFIEMITSQEWRNIFIIRDSDLSISDEADFYTNITDRLTGLRTSDISKIREKIIEIANLTSERLDFKKDIKRNMDIAQNLIREIEVLENEIKENRVDELEEEMVRKEEEIKMIEEEIKNFEDAQKREKYEKGKEALDTLNECLQKLNDLKEYNEKDAQLWRDCERDIEKYNKELEESEREIKTKMEEFKNISKELEIMERDFKNLDERKKKLDEDVKLELRNYEEKRGKIEGKKEKNAFFGLLGIISGILFGISLIGIIFKPSFLFYLLSGLFLILSVISMIFKFQLVKEKARLAETFEKLKMTLSRFGLGAENVEMILFNIQEFEELHRKKVEELQKGKNKKEKIEDEINNLRDKKLSEIREKIEEAKNKISEIKTKSREDSLEEYNKKLKKKQEFERLIEEKQSILKSHFREKNKGLQENLVYWKERIKELEKYKERAKELEYNEAVVSELKEKKEKLEMERKEINEKLKSIQKKMEDIERGVNVILKERYGYFYCKTSADLRNVKDKLREFINENIINAENARKVIQIFEEIEKEEKEKIASLFGKGSQVSEHFRNITNGLYEEVHFENNTIKVKKKDGTFLGPKNLSGGAYDQLYFSIRLALAEKILKGEKGFFILDDPFIKSDPDRLERLIEMLKKISESGWQILYFSAKKEIKDALQRYCEERNGYFEMREGEDG
jgi:DNA repair exonuclease SbcCD ATPase subunit